MLTKPTINKITGFTLVELIVVILIIGILSITIAPRFSGVTSYEDRKVADELHAALRHTQQMAMNRGGDIELVLTATNFTVQISGGTPLRSPDGRLTYTTNFPANVVVTPVPTTVSFDSLGRPNAGHIISIGALQITVEELTGYAY